VTQSYQAEGKRRGEKSIPRKLKKLHPKKNAFGRAKTKSFGKKPALYRAEKEAGVRLKGKEGGSSSIAKANDGFHLSPGGGTGRFLYKVIDGKRENKEKRALNA